MDFQSAVSLAANLCTIASTIGLLITGLMSVKRFKNDTDGKYRTETHIFYTVIRKREVYINQRTMSGICKSNSALNGVLIAAGYLCAATITVWFYIHLQFYILVFGFCLILFVFLNPLIYFLVHPVYRSKSRFNLTLLLFVLFELYLGYISFFPSQAKSYAAYIRVVNQMDLFKNLFENVKELVHLYGPDFINSIFAIASLIIYLMALLLPLVQSLVAKIEKRSFYFDYKGVASKIGVSIILSTVAPWIAQYLMANLPAFKSVNV